MASAGLPDRVLRFTEAVMIHIASHAILVVEDDDTLRQLTIRSLEAERYCDRHNIRYFGLLAPRVKSRTHDAVFALLGQERLGKPRRLRWAASMKKSFGVDPLLDREGQRMRWTRRLPPTPGR